MIVLDASVVVELLKNDSAAEAIRHELAESGESIIAPHIMDVEVVSVLRRLVLANRLDRHRCDEFLMQLDALPAERFPHTPLLGRMWELRHNFGAYDATYIALAEATGSVLYTCDEKLRNGHRAPVVVFTLRN